MLDLVVRNAEIHDGSGGPARGGDVGVRDGRIAAVGRVAERGREEVDARGAALAPGFIDPHTHLDAQLFWDPTLAPSSTFGVTTVVTGNCGYAFAPVDEATRDYVVATMSTVEQIPRDAIESSLPFDWKGLPDYFARLEALPSLLNHATLVGHVPVRAAVLGSEAAATRAARSEELGEMVALVRQGLALGALGFSTDQVEGNVGPGGSALPGQVCADEELLAVAGALREGPGPGLLTMANRALLLGREARHADLDWHQRLAEASGRPVVVGPMFDDWSDRGIGLELMQRMAQESRPGRTVVPQVLPRIFELWLRVDEPNMVVGALPSLRRAQRAGREALRALAADPRAREQLRHEAERLPEIASLVFSGRWDHVRVVLPRPERAAWAGRDLADLARERGVHPVDVLLDLAVEEEFETQFATIMRNDDEDEVERLVEHPAATIGGSDAGAHVLINTDSCCPVWLLQRWVRERRALSLPRAVHLLTGRNADLLGLRDRGRIASGRAADLVLFDPDGLRVTGIAYADDLPGGSRRLVPRAEGILLSVVNGELATRDGTPTSARPGQLLRGG